MPNLNPEQLARDNIDKQLVDCGWIIQGIKQVNLHAGPGIAVKEYLKDVGPVDYLLFVDGKPCGVNKLTLKKSRWKVAKKPVQFVMRKPVCQFWME